MFSSCRVPFTAVQKRWTTRVEEFFLSAIVLLRGNAGNVWIVTFLFISVCLVRGEEALHSICFIEMVQCL